MKISEVLQILENWAPPSLQESYDNAQLLCGDRNEEVTKTLVTLDCTEKVVLEAIEKGCNLIIAHHPIIFSGFKAFNWKLIRRTDDDSCHKKQCCYICYAYQSRQHIIRSEL